jgi:two-component system, chemotaxis family, sensor kinase CheA
MVFDKSKFIAGFKAETKEHIQKLTKGFLKLEKNPKQEALLNDLMREAHTIKGSAVMMGFNRISDIAHVMEDGIEHVIKQKAKMAKKHFDLLLECLDAIESLLEDKVTWEAKGITRPYTEDLCANMMKVFSGFSKEKTKSVKTEKKEISKKSVKKQELKESVVKKDIKEKISDKDITVDSTEQESLRVSLGKLNKLMNLSGTLRVSEIGFKTLVKDLTVKLEKEKYENGTINDLVIRLKTLDESLDFTTAEVQREVMNLRMLPISYLFNTFPRAMRDLANEKGKDVELEIIGDDVDVDKLIIDEMKDPIMHLLRNAVDHGIEVSAEREKKNKLKTGKILLNSYQKGSQIVIEVSDDGSGIDIDKVKKTAIKRGLIDEHKIKEMSEQQVFQFLFTPGFSTNDEVTDVSGRGVGMDVVKEHVAGLKGIINIESKKDVGTTFTIKLPLTLSTSETLLIGCGNDVFAIPADMILKTIRMKPEDVKTVEAKEVITVDEHILPLVKLNNIFNLPTKGIIEKRFLPVVIVQFVEKKICLLVDQIIKYQEIVFKSLARPLEKFKNIAGGTILEDGRVILILDIPSLIQSAEGAVVKSVVEETESVRKVVKGAKKTILLAEDALSTAMLEKNILESAGFSVVIAHDGQEALKISAQEKFDLVITDVLMPKMDGFELTQNLKKDKLYKDVPIIIVTTRESDEDKRKGLSAGADAYLLKSEFTSDTLLDVIERLIG